MGRKKKEEKKSYMYKNLLSIVLIFLGIIVSIAFIQPQDTVMKTALVNLLGASMLFLGFFILVLGLFLSPLINFKKINTKFLLGFLCLFFASLLFDGLGSKSSTIGGIVFNIFSGFVGSIGVLVLSLMFFVLSLYLVFSSKFILFIKKYSRALITYDYASLLKLKLPKKEEKQDEDSIMQQLDFDFNTENDSKEEAESYKTVEETSTKNKKDEDSEYTLVNSPSEPLELFKINSKSNKSLISSLGAKDKSLEVENLDSTNENFATKPVKMSNNIWEYPPLDLLEEAQNTGEKVTNVNEKINLIEKTLLSFGVKSKVEHHNSGPTVTQYALRVDEGTKTSKITNLQNDLALALASKNGQVRIEAPIPGKSLIGVEVPNDVQRSVFLRPILNSAAYKKQKEKSKLTIVLGEDVGGNLLCYPINKMPHLLVAGATGSGKSVMIHSIIFSILFANSPDECKFIMIDPKMVELVQYNDIPHLITPVITDNSEAVNSLKWVVGEMEKRLQTLSSFSARNIEAYNEKSGFQAMPYIVVVIDELADLMMTSSNEIEKYIVRIAQLSRATGIHLVLATQRPSTDIITGSIKANVPARIAFNVSSGVDSRVIVDTVGAEKLLGKGDMLFLSPEASKPVRIQGVWVKDEEISRLVNFLKASDVEPNYNPEVVSSKQSSSVSGSAKWEDDLFPDAVKIVVEYGRGSASLLQRRLSVGYARAARILDELEENGVVSSSDGSKSREVLIDDPSDVLG